MQKRPQFRKKPPADEGGAVAAAPSAPRPAAKKTVALSFDPDEEGPLLKIKKKKKRTHSALPALHDELPPAPASSAGTYSVNFLQQLRASQHTRTVEPETAALVGVDAVGGAGMPSADAIRLAREARERARRIAADEDEGAGYIPLDGADDGASEALVARMAQELRQPEEEQEEQSRGGGSGRLVREEQEGDDHGVDEMGGGDGGTGGGRSKAGRPRVTFGAAIGPSASGAAGVVPSSVWRGTDARHASTVVEVEHEEEERTSRAAARGAEVEAAASLASGSSDTLAAVAARLSAREFVSALDEKMAGQVGAIHTRAHTHARAHAHTHTHTHSHAHTHVYVRMYACMYIHTVLAQHTS